MSEFIPSPSFSEAEPCSATSALENINFLQHRKLFPPKLRPGVSSSLRYLITAPLSFRLDAVETVLLQLFGFTDEVTVHVFLKTSMAPDHVVLAREAVTLNTKNNHQATTKVKVRCDTQKL